MMAFRFVFFLIPLVILSPASFAQTTYSKVTGYISVVHPIVTYSNDKPVTNFKDYYLVGFPTGINIWKSPKLGFSFEVIPYIKSENGSSKMNNLTFHPGVLVSMGHGFTFIGRAAFETSGRYGVTPVFNKTIIKNKECSYFIAIPLPIRFGNEKPTTFTFGFQFGVTF